MSRRRPEPSHFSEVQADVVSASQLKCSDVLSSVLVAQPPLDIVHQVSCLTNQATEVVTDLRILALCTPLCSLYPAFTGGGAENPWHQDTSEHALHSFRVAANLHSPPGLQLQMCVADGNCMFTAVSTVSPVTYRVVT